MMAFFLGLLSDGGSYPVESGILERIDRFELDCTGRGGPLV